MAAFESNSDKIFDNIIEELMADKALGLGEDNQSDISISSVHTSDLSDFEDLSDEEIFTTEWSDIVIDNTPKQFNSFVGPKIPLGLDAKPVEYFFQLFPLTLIEDIVHQTNLYAEQSGDVLFVRTCVAEIRAYLGMLFFMGIVPLPNYRCYWSKTPGLKNCVISEIMCRNRFEQITKYFHLNDSTQNLPRTHPEHDKLHKVRPILDNAETIPIPL